LTGEIGDSMRQHLNTSMLTGPFPTEVVLTLKEYYSLGESEIAQRNSTAAQWWWTLFEGYWEHLGLLRRDRSRVHSMKDANNISWNQVWTDSKRMFFQGKLELMKAHLHQSKYREAISNTHGVTCELSRPLTQFNYSVSPILKAKFCLGTALAYTLLFGDIEMGSRVLKTAAEYLLLSGRYSHHADINNVKNISRILQISINTEYSRLKSQDPYERRVYLRGSEARYWEAECNRSFWEWLDLPEA
jgi:hypothetical protein